MLTFQKTRTLLAFVGLLVSSISCASEPLFTSQDLQYLHHMSIHHQQAVDMSDLLPGRTDRQEFHRYASFVERAQAAEIAYMHSLMDLAEERGQRVHREPLTGDPPMYGMLSSAQMQALKDARDAEFERLWLEGMIYHHQGAIDMSYTQQQHQLDTGRRPYGLAVLVEDIIVEQRYEITKMHRWLREWGLVDHNRNVDEYHDAIMKNMAPASVPSHDMH